MILLLLALACGGEAPAPPAPTTEEAPKAPGPSGLPMGEHRALRMAMLQTLQERLGDAYAAPVPGLDEADLAQGEALYRAHCLRCHGETGRGGPDASSLVPHPSDLSHPGKARFFSDAGRLEIIRAGFTGTAMQGYGEGQGAGVDLSEAQLKAVYAHVRSLRAPAPEGARFHDSPDAGPAKRP
ncbi:MAG: cytochrome c [Alphaproteobacteria bacterium]|nr:cytochrome c [Alphaproteobacteria bacterium]